MDTVDYLRSLPDPVMDRCVVCGGDYVVEDPEHDHRICPECEEGQPGA